MRRKLFKLENIIGLFGLFLAIASWVGKWDVMISIVLFTIGVLLAIWALTIISGEWGESYKHIKYIWDVKILDETGTKAIVQLFSCLKIRRRLLTEGWTSWSNFPHNLKTFITYANNLSMPIDKIEIPHGSPVKRGGMFDWAFYLNPPLLKGQIVWIIDEFEMKDEYTTEHISDFFNSFRTIHEFEWRFHFPPQRPAKRWYGVVDFLTNKGDNKILAEGNQSTTEVIWHFDNTKKGVVYRINVDW